MLVTEFQGGLYEDVEFISPKGTEFRLPKKVAQHHEFRRFLPKLVEAAREGKSMPDEVPDGLRTASLESFLDSLAKVIEDEGDSVWTWYMLNTLGPSQLSEKKVNRILANPPWVRMSNIQVRSRKKEIESLARKLELWVGGKHATGFDVAALFILRCRNLYLDEKTGKAAWITNNAAIRGGNWEGFRERYGQFLAKMIDYGKLKGQPFKGAKSCALIEDNSTKAATTKTTEKLFHLVNVRKRISPYWRWEEVRDATYLEPAPEPIPKEESDYVGKFRNGATLFPHCLLLVEKMNTEKGGRVMVETRKSRHAPWKNIESPRETVPRRWITPCIFSEDLLPFTIRPEITQVIVPLGEDGVLEKDPEKDVYWENADRLWKKNKGKGKRTPSSLLDQINFNSKLQKQLPVTMEKTELLQVVYNEAGQHLRATRCNRSKIVVEHACYWWGADSEEEAQYLVSMLNSQCLQDAYRECRKSDRHFETHIWNGVPIPCYEPRNDDHLELAGLCLEAENLVAKILRDLDLSNKQEKLSRQIKGALKESGISDRIDEAARKVLPDQAS